MMTKGSLLTSTAVALVLCIAPALAQQQKEGMPGGNATGGEGRAAQNQKEQGSAPKANESSHAKGKEAQGDSKGQAKGAQNEPQGKAKGSAEEKGPATKGSAQTQPKEQGTSKGTAQTQQKQHEQGSAQTQQSREQAGKATATDTNKGASPKGSDTAKGPSTGGRVQLSEQQRTSVHSTILKEANVNRATNVNFSISVGTRVPRSVHLVALPASVISLVPQYRDYRYFVVNDQICIVEPNSYEIVDVIVEPGRSAALDNRGSMARLTLTEEEKAIILREVGRDGGSTMGLGALSEGAEVPRDVQVRAFPASVVREVPKVKDYKYFAAEGRVAIVDPQGSKVQLVIDERR
jgi:Protein of unknown function (DUF1236)